jgi:hypothetical protein
VSSYEFELYQGASLLCFFCGRAAKIYSHVAKPLYRSSCGRAATERRKHEYTMIQLYYDPSIEWFSFGDIQGAQLFVKKHLIQGTLWDLKGEIFLIKKFVSESYQVKIVINCLKKRKRDNWQMNL